MKPKLILLFSFCFLANIKTLCGQTHLLQKVIVDETMKDTFAFTSKWAYAWYILKDDGGKFSSDYNEPITPADTAHLFFTANCETNIQGGYVIKYCYASKKGKTIQLHFDDGSPIYGGELHVYVTADSFYVKPEINYPTTYGGERLIHVLDRQKLVLNKRRYALGDNIIGYIDCAFTETDIVPGRKTQKNLIWFKRYFCTPFKSEENPRK
jgi:hypothetical protein